MNARRNWNPRSLLPDWNATVSTSPFPAGRSPLGRLHLITQTRREIEDIFVGMGYEIAEGPEIETEYYNFEALNTPADHPARSLHDTFFVSDGVLASHPHVAHAGARHGDSSGRRCTSSCPARLTGAIPTPPTRPMFHQVEGLVVDEGSPWPISRERWRRSSTPCSAPTGRSACARTSSPSPSPRSK